MFYYLNGTVTYTEQNMVVLDVGGVGFKVNVTTHTMSKLSVGKVEKLYTYCNIKEDAFDIYGFYDTSEKRSFELLLTVSGVGPKAALAILSTVTPENLALAILSGEEKTLTAVPGVGKRIAQRIILELKDKTAKESTAFQSGGIPNVISGKDTPNGKAADAAAALAVLGYSQAEISAAMRHIDIETLSVEDIIKQVLKNTMK